jgi:UDP-glucose 4-epimerase
MKRKSILVTGGAGYIGSHVVRQLGEAGERIVTVDNLSRGFRESVLYGDLVVGDTGDSELLRKTMREYDVDTVMHFAAFTIVPESVAQPLKYYLNNTANTRILLDACQQEGVNRFVFSSTAAVYGEVQGGIACESTPTNPINPYGTSKLMSEWMLRDLAAATDFRFVALRYFNVAGSDPSGRIGQRTKGATLLTKVAVEHAVGLRPHVSIFGTDYETADGTGVRDYIHVEDLANAHLAALKYLRSARGSAASQILNCGYGKGYSVRQVLNAVARVAGQPLNIKEEPKRAGDPPQLIAHASRIREILGWSPQHDDLDHIVRTALLWERQMFARAQQPTVNN